MNRNLLIFGLFAVAAGANAQSYFEGFEGTTGTPVTAIGPLPGWTAINNSSPINPAHGGWFSGATDWPAFEGNRWAGSNFTAGSGVATIDTWLMTPTRTMNNGDTFSFFTRAPVGSTFPDRMFLRMSLNGGSSAIGDFSTLLLSINPTMAQGGYPSAWTQFSVTLSGLGGPTSGRFAFNYNQTNGGPSGTNGDLVGVDAVRYTAVPEPATMAALGLGAVALIRRRRNSR